MAPAKEFPVKMSMEEPRRLAIGYGKDRVCTLVEVVRNHLDSMPGADRDRPGWDRVTLRLDDDTEVLTDLWSSPGQDISTVSGEIEVFDQGDLIAWRTPGRVDAGPEGLPSPANDGGTRMVG